jgi:hypothetical protein
MPRVLIPAEQRWYDELNAVAYYGEADLERSIRQHVNSVFEDFHVFPFKKEVVGRTTATKRTPDLAMVRRDFAAWGVIEIEIAEHDIRHVLDQTRVFAEGDYNAPEMAEYIRRQLKKHCRKRASVNRLTKLLSSQSPSVLVIADTHTKTWQEQLEQTGANLCIFEIYKSTRGKHIFRTCGNYPTVPIQEAHCRRHPSLANVLEVIGNFAFKNIRRTNQIYVSFEDIMTRWSLLTDKGKTYLQFLGRSNPLSPNTTYSLIADKRNKYYFETS